MNVTLKEFLVEGRLGAVASGLNREDVVRLLGEPDATTSRQARTAIWKYKSLQIGFDRDKLDFIGIYFYTDVALPESFTIDGYFPEKDTKLEEFRRYLYVNELNCDIDIDLTFDSQICIVVGLNVGVYFYADTKCLDSIQYTIIGHKKRRLRPC